MNFNTQQINSTINLKHLYILGDNIQKLKESHISIYEPITFGTIFSGMPNIYTGLNLPIIVVETFPTFLDSGFTGVGCHVIIDCKKLENIYDLDHRQIYEGSNGVLFIYNYTPPTKMSKIDKGIFLPPRVAFEESKEMHGVFIKAAEILVDQFNLPTDLSKITLANRVAELQINAFIQGKNSAELRPIEELIQSVENIIPLGGD